MYEIIFCCIITAIDIVGFFFLRTTVFLNQPSIISYCVHLVNEEITNCFNNVDVTKNMIQKKFKINNLLLIKI
jgi:hypothetical protein